ncbi:uncharacterized protein PHALS_13645 [Plasmopara halstedii]|uniref:Uncharacterized protein n=1 Tax=Plasmopara halstedii TaxID=4781 RepID=A0A0P1APQ1_PLAHL|nr:uncharacterized protein PHALS_13645 [Plasmopara halstedii]CEG43450.1 hypothetical protein PHALS_13645 [Plasmopara halstedii]|eukprot:XP_024579819.1 hypothetical protein PHALS_13645 [Plasmopara halstedii]
MHQRRYQAHHADLVGCRAEADEDAERSESKLPSGPVALTVPKPLTLTGMQMTRSRITIGRSASVFREYCGRQLNRKSSLPLKLVKRKPGVKLGVNFFLVFAAVISMTDVKFIFVIAFIWGVPVRLGDIRNAYEKATTKEDIEIFLFVSDGLVITEVELKALRAESVDENGLFFGQSLFVEAGRVPLT